MNDKTLTIRIDADLKSWLDILNKTYNKNRSKFIRDAIVEKMKRDIKQLRLSKKTDSNYCPF